jgi:L-alanine-DL-glutamate epimerase-like enolase superfamily enzyme
MSNGEFRIHELAKWIDWWPELVVHEGPFWEKGYFTIQDKPGLGIELNPGCRQSPPGAGRDVVGIEKE